MSSAEVYQPDSSGGDAVSMRVSLTMLMGLAAYFVWASTVADLIAVRR